MTEYQDKLNKIIDKYNLPEENVSMLKDFFNKDEFVSNYLPSIKNKEILMDIIIDGYSRYCERPSSLPRWLNGLDEYLGLMKAYLKKGKELAESDNLEEALKNV
jgi:hypothetical protein